MSEIVQNFIGGKLVPPRSGATLPVFEPATGRTYATHPDSDETDVADAVQAASAAFPAWQALTLDERSRHLRAIARLIERDREKLARAEAIDNGKPLSLCRSLDIPRASQNFDYFADAATQFASESHAMGDRAINYTLRNPLGVVGTISPWNLPLYNLTWKLAPAIAAGNTVVGKPSEVTPMTAHLLSQLIIEAGIPPGVINLVHGLGHKVGAAMCRHPDIKAISFTGSTLTGSKIAEEAAPRFKKVSLELGGKNPNIVFADCHFEDALASTIRSSFLNQGEICLCGSRIFVEKSIYSKFRDALVEKTRALKVGDPLEASTDQGALVSEAHFKKVLSYLDLAKQEGGKIVFGGKAVKPEGRCAGGWFIEPTLIENLGPKCKTNQDEIFGPVATLLPFETEGEVLEMANQTRYGLSASVHTRDLDRAHRVAGALQAGIVWINCWLLRDLRTPFGGVKDSGTGREGGWEAMRFFTEPKNVCIQIGKKV